MLTRNKHNFAVCFFDEIVNCCAVYICGFSWIFLCCLLRQVHAVMSHQFLAQQYFNTTLCYCCQTVIWGIGNQGYQCSSEWRVIFYVKLDWTR